MKRIAVLTSGGDAPGMNAAIRTVVRMGVSLGWEVIGIRNGYAGLFDEHLEPLGARHVGGILQRGGTFLGSARFPRWKEPDIRAKALDNLRAHKVDALVVIGGNGSQTDPGRRRGRVRRQPDGGIASRGGSSRRCPR